MASQRGASLRSRLSSRYLTSPLAETLFLVALGVVAVTLLAYLRFPLRVPGHKGLIWIGFMMVGRLFSQRRLAATTTSSSAAITSLLPIMGFKDPVDTVALLISGIALDLGFKLSSGSAGSVWRIAALGALAHTTKPLLKYGLQLSTGVPFASMVSGLPYPLVLHGLFGAIGGIAAAFIVKTPGARTSEQGRLIE